MATGMAIRVGGGSATASPKFVRNFVAFIDDAPIIVWTNDILRVTHNEDKTDFVLSLWDVSTNEEIVPDVITRNVNYVDLDFSQLHDDIDGDTIRIMIVF